MPKGHPFAGLYLEQIKQLYTVPQAELMSDLSEVPPEAFTTGQGRIRRNSVMMRTGPGVINVLAWNLGIASEDLPRFGGIQVDSALSWIDPPDRPAEETAVPGRADTLRVAQMVVQTLVRDLHNRQGDLHLTQVAPVVSRHPQPDLLWEAVLRFLADRPEFASRVVAVTDRREEPEGEVRVELPPAARELLHIDTETADDQQMHWLGEYLTPAALRPAPAPEQGAGEPTAAAPAQEPPAAGLRVPESVTPSANAVPKALWEHRRAGAVPARLRTEIYDPSSAPDRGGDRPHLLAGGDVRPGRDPAGAGGGRPLGTGPDRGPAGEARYGDGHRRAGRSPGADDQAAGRPPQHGLRAARLRRSDARGGRAGGGSAGPRGRRADGEPPAGRVRPVPLQPPGRGRRAGRML
ncbi:hypothetical protein SFUMM280S_00884 [Streptomyces fumanus]